MYSWSVPHPLKSAASWPASYCKLATIIRTKPPKMKAIESASVLLVLAIFTGHPKPAAMQTGIILGS